MGWIAGLIAVAAVVYFALRAGFAMGKRAAHRTQPNSIERYEALWRVILPYTATVEFLAGASMAQLGDFQGILKGVLYAQDKLGRDARNDLLGVDGRLAHSLPRGVCHDLALMPMGVLRELHGVVDQI